MGGVVGVDVGLLRERFLNRFLEAWPERDVSEGVIESGLEIEVVADDQGPVLVVRLRLLGRVVSVGFDGSQGEADELVDELAIRLADDAEGDRWIHGEGWREYRPGS